MRQRTGVPATGRSGGSGRRWTDPPAGQRGGARQPQPIPTRGSAIDVLRELHPRRVLWTAFRYSTTRGAAPTRPAFDPPGARCRAADAEPTVVRWRSSSGASRTRRTAGRELARARRPADAEDRQGARRRAPGADQGRAGDEPTAHPDTHDYSEARPATLIIDHLLARGGLAARRRP